MPFVSLLLLCLVEFESILDVDVADLLCLMDRESAGGGEKAGILLLWLGAATKRL